MIQAVKHNEQTRQEYRFMSGFEMDAREEGRLEGRSEGLEQGIAQGFSDGAYQKALETARLMKNANCELDFIMQMTGLTKEEVESIS